MSAVAPEVPAVPELAALKARQQIAWSSGDYAVIGTTLQIVGETLCEALDVRAGWQVLDVAAGNGNASLAAARRGCAVTSTDYVGALLDAGRRRADAEGLAIRFQEADAENLPFADGAFDAVVSTFGVMFTPRQEQAAHELLRVCRPGGRIGLANWTPDGFIGQVFRTLGRYLPAPAGVPSPALWGTRERLLALFAPEAKEIRTTARDFVFRYRSPEHWIEVFRTYYGPIQRACAALPPEREQALVDELLDLLWSHNRAGDGTLVLPSRYLEVVIEVR